MAVQEKSRSLSLLGERGARKFQRDMLYLRSIFSAEQMAKFNINEADLTGAGNEYRVYLCKSLDCVFKVPRERKIKAAATVEQVKRDLGMAHAYFTFEQLVQTDIISNQNGQFIVKQKALPIPHGITKEDMQDGEIAKQVYAILENNKKMVEETGFSLGLLGKDGAMHSWFSIVPGVGRLATPSLSNLLVFNENTGKKKVMIADFGLIDINSRDGSISYRANMFFIDRNFARR